LKDRSETPFCETLPSQSRDERVVVPCEDLPVADSAFTTLKNQLLGILAFLVYYSGFIHLLRFIGRHDTKILLYHSVDETESYFVKGTSMCVTPDLFVKHLEYVLDHYNVIPLKTLVDSLGIEVRLSRGCVITFDDGFADNYVYAYPKLREFNIPASIFLITDCVAKSVVNWLQELCYLVNTKGEERVFESMSSITEGNGTGFRSNGSSPDKRLHRYLQDYLTYSVEIYERDQILNELFESLEIERDRIPGADRIFLKWEQICEMADHGITFGNHGKTHTPLSGMTPYEQERELSESRKILNDKLETDFVPFAYPFGQTRDIPGGSQEIVRRVGHDAALTAMPIRNPPCASPFELGRIPVHNVPVYRFAFEIEKETLKKLLRWSS